MHGGIWQEQSGTVLYSCQHPGIGIYSLIQSGSVRSSLIHDETGRNIPIYTAGNRQAEHSYTSGYSLEQFLQLGTVKKQAYRPGNDKSETVIYN